MERLILDEIAILDQENHLAKCCSFVDGINVITSNAVKNGSFVGKSVVVKSIFRAFGAEPVFDDQWDVGRLYYYYLRFHVSNKKYVILRHGNYFRILDLNDGSLILKTPNKGDVSSFISKILGYHVSVLDASTKKYNDASPDYYFPLSFLSQSTSNPCTFQQFNGISDSEYKDVILNNMGINSADYFKLKEELAECRRKNNGLSFERTVIDRAISEINDAKGSSTDLPDIQNLKKEIELNRAILEEKQKDLLAKKDKLLELSKEYNELVIFLGELNDFLASSRKNDSYVLEKHSCPYCKSEISNTSSVYFDNSIKSENLNKEKEETEGKIAEIKAKLDVFSQDYKTSYDDLEELEKTIFTDNSNYQDILTKYGLRKIKEQIIDKRFQIDSDIDTNKKNIQKCTSKLGDYETSIRKIDEDYLSELKSIKENYPAAQLNISSIVDINSRTFHAEDNARLFAKTAWICALHKTQESNNSRAIASFPFVLDDPVNGDLDAESRKIILKIIFGSHINGEQMIVAAVGFNASSFPDIKAHVITFSNEPRHVMTAQDFPHAKELVDLIDPL